MNQVEKQHLLSAKDMAKFVTDGYLLIEGLVPEDLNNKIYQEQKEWKRENTYRFWLQSKNIRAVFELPQVKGIIQGLLGENPIYDHSFMHIVRANNHKSQQWHVDSVIDTRPYGFDLMLFYFSHDTPAEMGPTLVLPGSHLRRVSNETISRYKNILGQKQLVAKAGSIAFLHQGIWHCAQPNFTDQTRYVFKLRLRPSLEQRGLFNLEGYDSPEVTSIVRQVQGYYPWQGIESRADHIHRAKLWRYVTNDDNIDVSFENSLTRMNL